MASRNIEPLSKTAMEKNWRRILCSKWFLFGIASLILIFGIVFTHDFLAVNDPVGAGILVVEGWIPAPALAESAKFFNSRHYSHLVVVGGPVQANGTVSDHALTYADLAASRLEKLGFDSNKLVKISVPDEPTGLRTLSSAAEVKRWLDSSGTVACCVDVFTIGVHARKTWVFFRSALGDYYRVGIISGSEVSYDRASSWFLSTRGIWIFVRSLVGYGYSKVWVLFHGNSHPRITSGPQVAEAHFPAWGCSQVVFQY
jgi:hypothetical protein